MIIIFFFPSFQWCSRFLNENYLSGTIPPQLESRCTSITTLSDKSFLCNIFTAPTSSNCMFSTEVACPGCPSGSSPAASNIPRGQCAQASICAANTLSFPPNVTSAGTCVGDIPAGSTCHQRCSNGGNYTYFCRLGVFFPSNAFPRCNGTTLTCWRPSNTPSTVFSSTCPSAIVNGTVCNPVCASGYTSNGSLAQLCLDGNLTAPLGNCAPNPCIRPADDLSTSYSQSCPISTESGLSCTPTCSSGYTATSSLQRDCFAGVFSSASGTCQPSPCIAPVDDASTLYQSCRPMIASGSSCTLACKSGYNATASLTIQCLFGNFSSPAGICSPNPCLRPPNTTSTSYSSCLSSTPSSVCVRKYT